MFSPHLFFPLWSICYCVVQFGLVHFSVASVSSLRVFLFFFFFFFFFADSLIAKSAQPGGFACEHGLLTTFYVLHSHVVHHMQLQIACPSAFFPLRFSSSLTPGPASEPAGWPDVLWIEREGDCGYCGYIFKKNRRWQYENKTLILK